MSLANNNPDSDIPDYFLNAFPGGIGGAMTRIGFRLVGWALRLLVRIRKSFWLPKKILLITGFDLAQEVFSRSEEFQTTNDSKTDVIRWIPPYLLARRKDDAIYKDEHKLTREIFADPALLATLPAIAAEQFEQLLPPPAHGETWATVDLDWGYMYPGFMGIVEKYYGIDIREEDVVKFVCAMLVVSGFFFGRAKPRTNPSIQADAKRAFEDAWEIVEGRVQHWQANPGNAIGAMKVAVDHGGHPSTHTLTSHFLGMIMGFIPTNGNGHARITETLFSKSKAMDWALHYVSPAADAEKDGEFLAVLHECLRMNYILPGIWREAKGLNLVIGKQSKRPVSVPPDSILLISGMAAMFDPDHMTKPFKFLPDRSYWSYLNYGHKMHFCVGWDISNIIMTEYYRALIVRKIELKPGGEVVLRSIFPWRKDARYKRPGA